MHSVGILCAVFLSLGICHAQNQPPDFNTGSLTTTGWAAGIGFSGNASGNVVDPDGDPLTYSLTGPSWLSMAPDGSYSGTGPTSAVGTNTFTLTATDPSGASDSIPFFVIIPINNPPSWNPAPRILPGAPENVFYTNSLAPFVTDPEGRNLTYTLISGPDWLSMNSGGIVFGTPRSEDVGDNTAVVEMEDEVNPAQQGTIIIPVLEVNDPPQVIGSPFTVNGLAAYSFFSRSIVLNTIDEEGDPYEFSLLSGPSWLSLTRNGVASGTPIYSDIGTNIFAYQIADFTGGSDTGSLQLVVNPPSCATPLLQLIPLEPVVEERRLIDENLELKISNLRTGLPYRMELSTDLPGGVWSTATVLTFDTATVGSYTNVDNQVSQFEITNPTVNGTAELTLNQIGLAPSSRLFFRLRLPWTCP